MVVMGSVDDDFIPEFGIASRDQPEHVRALGAVQLHVHRDRGRDAQWNRFEVAVVGRLA